MSCSLKFPSFVIRRAPTTYVVPGSKPLKMLVISDSFKTDINSEVL